MTGGSIRVMMDIAGIEDARRAADELGRLRNAASQLQQMTSSPFQPFEGPMGGLAGGRLADESHLRIVTDMWKQVVSLNTELDTYYRNVMNVGNAYGYQRDQMIAVRQEFQMLQSLGAQGAAQAGSLGFARGYGMDPTQVASGMGAFYGMGAVNQGNQPQMMEMLASAVARGSQGGMNIMMDRFLPIVQSLASQQLMSTPTGVTPEMVGGIAGTLTRFNQSGIYGFRDEGGMRAYQGVNQAIQGATGGVPGAVLFGAMAEGNPDYDYAQYLQDIAKGASDPETQKRLLTSIYRLGPQGNDEKTQNWRAVYANAVMPNMDVATLKAMFTTYFDAEGNYIENPDLGGLGQRYGAKGATDPTALPLLARLDTAKTQEDILGVMGAYRDVAGKPLNYTPTGDFEKDKQAIGGLLANQTSPLMSTQADRMDATLARTAALYEDAAHEMFEFNQALREANERVAVFMHGGITEGTFGPALFGASMLGQGIGGIMGGISTGSTMLLGARALGMLGPAAATGTAVAPGMLTGGAGIGMGSIAGAAASALAVPALLGSVAYGTGLISTAIGQQLDPGHREGQNPLIGALAGPGQIYQGGMRRLMGEDGLLGDTGLGQWWRGRDEETARDNPLYRLMFGMPEGSDDEDTQKKQLEKLEGIYEEARKQNQNQNFNEVASRLIAGGMPSGQAYDMALQEVYGSTNPQGDRYPTLPGGQQGPVLPGSTPGTTSTPGGSSPPAAVPGGTAATPYGATASSAQAKSADPASGAYRDIIEREAKAAGIDPDIIQAMIMKESSGNPNAINYNDGGPGVHSMGLMQINNTFWPKGTPESVMLDPTENIRMGIQVLLGKRQTVRQMFGEDLDPREEMHRTIAAYNGSLNWKTGGTTTGYASDVETNVGTIKGPQPGPAPSPRALRSGGGDALTRAATDPSVGPGTEAYEFMGRVQLEVMVNGEANGQTPVLEFGRAGGTPFARILNYPRGGV